MAELVLEMLIALPVVLLWLTVVSVLVRPFGVRLPLTFQLGQAQVRLSISHLLTVRHSRRNPVLWLRDVDCHNFVALPRMEILAWPIHFHRKLPPRCHAIPRYSRGFSTV